MLLLKVPPLPLRLLKDRIARVLDMKETAGAAVSNDRVTTSFRAVAEEAIVYEAVDSGLMWRHYGTPIS